MTTIANNTNNIVNYRHEINLFNVNEVIDECQFLCDRIDEALNINDYVVTTNKNVFRTLFENLTEEVKNEVLANASYRVKDEYLYTVLLPLD